MANMNTTRNSPQKASPPSRVTEQRQAQSAPDARPDRGWRPLSEVMAELLTKVKPQG